MDKCRIVSPGYEIGRSWNFDDSEHLYKHFNPAARMLHLTYRTVVYALRSIKLSKCMIGMSVSRINGLMINKKNHANTGSGIMNNYLITECKNGRAMLKHGHPIVGQGPVVQN